MKTSRAVILGLVVAVSLAAVPVATASNVVAPAGRLVADHAGWLESLLERVATWLGWDGGREIGRGDLRATPSPVKPPTPGGDGSGAGPVMTGNCDEGSGMDPVGNPCER